MTQVDDCAFPITYTASFLKGGVSATQPSWLTWDLATRTWTVATITSPNTAAVGTWTVSNNAMAGTYSQPFTFTITVSCVVSTLTNTSQPADASYDLDGAGFTTAALTFTQTSACA